MTTVIVKVSGGAPKEVQAETLGELKQKLNLPKYQATIGGEVVDANDYELAQDEVVILTEQVKGAQ